MTRGFIKALGIQNRIMMAHLIVQGFFGLILTYLFGFYFDFGLNGIWLAKTCMIYSLVFYYIFVLRRADWSRIISEAYKKHNDSLLHKDEIQNSF